MAKISSVTFHFVLKALEKNSLISIDEMLKYADLPKEVLLEPHRQIDSAKLSEIFRFCMEKTGKRMGKKMGELTM